MIDEEGKLYKLKNIINHNINANFFGGLFEKDKHFCRILYKTLQFSHYVKFLEILALI